MNIFYLGPSGTFTHEAAKTYFPQFSESQLIPCKTPTEVMQRVAGESEAYGVVPIENSVQGEVIPTLDALCFEFSDIFVVGEVSLAVTFNWYAITEDAKPHTVASHPHALAQCKRFVSSRGLTEQTTSSTAEACRLVAERADPGLTAIASPSAGALFGLSCLKDGIEDHSGAFTRFLIVQNRLSHAADSDRTMLALLPPKNSLGILAEFAGIFFNAGINVLGIHARPLRTGLGNYLFIITLQGDGKEGATRVAIEKLLTLGYGAKILGIYKGWHGEHPAAPWPHLRGLLDRPAYLRLIAKEQQTDS